MTGVSTLGQALTQIDLFKDLQNNFGDLSTQLATGKKTQVFSGLKSDVLATQRARADFRTIDGYINNITNADRRIDLALTALQEFKEQTENFAGALIGFSQQGSNQDGNLIIQDDPTTTATEITQIGYSSANMDVDFDNLQALAESVSKFMLDLVNAQEGDRYLFAGADTFAEPLNNLDILDAQMSTSITNWKNEGSPNNITTAQFISDLQDRTTSGGNLDAFTDSIVGYSSSLSAGTAGNTFVRISDESELDYTSLGNSDGFRDVFVAVSYFKNESLGPISDVYAEPYTFGDTPTTEGAPGATIQDQQDNFYDVFNSLTQMVVNAIDQLDSQIADLQSVQARMIGTQNNYKEDKNLFLEIINDVENADINQVAVQLNSLEITLDASFRVVSRVQELSLVNFI